MLFRSASYIKRTTGEIRPELERQNIVLEMQDPPAVTLQLNPERLTHVFFNLCNNAADFMPKGGKIMMRFAVKEKSLLLEIEDTGPGIAPEIAGRLFEPFATFGKPQGTGLGLSICRKIIEDHHGHIAARHEPGRGAIFVLRLPLPA